MASTRSWVRDRSCSAATLFSTAIVAKDVRTRASIRSCWPAAAGWAAGSETVGSETAIPEAYLIWLVVATIVVGITNQICGGHHESRCRFLVRRSAPLRGLPRPGPGWRRRDRRHRARRRAAPAGPLTGQRIALHQHQRAAARARHRRRRPRPGRAAAL